MNGFLNILKPPGMTSAAVVGAVKRLTGERHVGHAGTLDPEAAGVLPVMAGRAAKLFDYLVDKEKEYIAVCAFGCATDTQDAQGRVTRTGENYPDLEQVRRAAEGLTGDILQRPGIYSAVKQNGRRMYSLARAGEAAEAPLRTVHVERIDVLGEDPPHGVLLRVACGRGTYIRSLCEDLGRAVGCPAHMRFLLRTRSGPFTLETAMTLEEAAAKAEAGTLAEALLSADMPLQHLPALAVDGEAARLARCGTALSVCRVPGAGALEEGIPVRICGEEGFLGIAAREGDRLRWRYIHQP